MTRVRKIGGGSQIRAGLSGYVAELSSAMLGAELGLPVTHLDSHASYIEHWLKLLKDDDRATQYVLTDDEAGYIAVDEGDYGALPKAMLDRVIDTVPGRLSDEF